MPNPSLSIRSRNRPFWFSFGIALILCMLLALSQDTLFGGTGYASKLRMPSSDDYLYLQQWGNGGLGNGQFSSPRDVAFDTNNHWLYVADEINGRVQKFDSNGNYLAQWAGLNKPYGVAVAPDSTVYVTNTKKNKVRHYDTNGNLLKQWGSKGNSSGQFQNPHGIAVDKNGNVYVADTDNSRIQKFNSAGKFLKAWSATKSGSTPLANPYGVAVDPNLNVFVADTGYHRIVRYDANGKFKKMWGSEGTTDSKFKFPRGVDVDNTGNVYVVDDQNYRVQKFTGNGVFLSKLGGAGSGNGQFNQPHGIAVEPSGDYFYVGDTNNNRVQKFQREGLVTPTSTATYTPTMTRTPTNTPSPTPGCAPRPSGVVSWWKAEGNANDSVGSNHGSLQNGATFGTGHVGQAFSFDGTNDHITVPHDSSLDPQAITVEGWVVEARTPANGTNDLVASKYDGNGWLILVDSNRDVAFAVNRQSLPSVWVYSTGPIALNTWTHIAATYDGTTARLYINGVLQQSLDFPGGYGTSSSALEIGMASWTSSGYLGGLVDELTLYNRALSATEIGNIYEAGSFGKCSN